jgi:trichodiene synthase
MFPKAQFDEEATFREITSVISQMENWMVFVNDLMSFYKEFDEPRDQTSLVNSYVQCERITLDDALKKLTHDTIVCSEQLMAVFKDRDQKVAETLFSFCQGYVTWHLCDARYRLSELCEDAGTYPAGAPFRAYQQAGRQVGGVNPTDWAFPSIAMLAESQKEQQVQQQQQLQPHHEGKVLLSSTTRQNKEWLLYPDQHLRIILRSVFGFLWRHWLNLGR